VPSTLTWKRKAGLVGLSQESAYPADGTVHLRIESAPGKAFTVHLRIPEWAGNDAAISINGVRYSGAVRGGEFASLKRAWRSNDRIDLVLPMSTRLEPVDAETSGTVALLRGPLVLFSLGQGSRTFRERDLLAARKLSADEWLVPSMQGDVHFRPFTAIHEEAYSTYVNLAQDKIAT